METFRPNYQRAKNAMVCLWINVLVLFLNIIADIYQYNLLKEIKKGKTFAQETLQTNDMIQQVLALITAILMTITAIMFIMWFRRAYYNLHTKMDHLSYSEGWAAGYWFIPIASLYTPYKIMKEMMFGSHTLITNHDETYDQEVPHALIRGWWFFWVTGSLADSLYFRLSEKKIPTINDLISETTRDLISSTLLIAAAVLGALAVKKYNAMEEIVETIVDEESGDLSKHLAIEGAF
jgi:hypothetical protein